MTGHKLKLAPDNNDPKPEQGQNRRGSKRISFYRGEFPNATIIVNNRPYEAEIVDISSKSIGLTPCSEIQGIDLDTKNIMIQLHKSPPRRALLKNISHTKFAGSHKIKLGLEFDAEDIKRIDESKIVDLHNLMPMAYSDDPVAFKRVMMFNIAYFAPDGLGLVCKSDHSTIFPGLVIDLSVMLPARGEFHAVAEVLSIGEQEGLALLNCRWISINEELSNRISEFILMTEDQYTIANLRERGFTVGSLERAFVFNYARTESEMRRILELRLKAAQADGRWIGETDVEKMRDAWDKYARQVYCEVNGRVVAAGRVVFNNGDRARSEHEGNYKVEVPQWLWDEGFAESSRVCTDPEFRGADVFTLMLQNVCKVAASSGNRYVVLNCVDNLVPVYRKTSGIKPLGKRFFTEYMQDRALNLLYGDLRNTQLGLNLDLTTWVVHAPIGNHRLKTGTLKLKWWEVIPHKIAQLAHKVVIARYEKSKLAGKSQRKTPKK